MLYIYYMKIKIFLLSFLFLSPLFTQAQITVVRVKDGHVYLDTSSAAPAPRKGDLFKVILSSEKLTNPKTGKELGLLYNYSPEGTITEVQPLYAVGKLPSLAGVEIGQEAVLERTTAAAEKTSAAEVTPEPAAAQHKKISYEPVEQEIISLSSADITAPGDDNVITLSTKGEITVWHRRGEKLEQALSYQLPAGKTPLTLSAAPLRQRPTAEIFATVYDANLARVSTLVLAYENNAWTVLDTLPYFVKEIGCGADKKIWAQRAFILGDRPGNAREVLFEKEKFTVTAASLSTQHNWLTGLNLFPAGQEDPSLLYTTSHGRIRLNLPNGKTAENKGFTVGAPNRVKYKQDIVKFYPSLQVVQSQGRTQAVAVENTAKLGLLSSAFGQYDNGKIHFLSLEKGRLAVTDTVTLDGFAYDTACSQTAVLSAEVLPDGQSSVVEILK